MHERSVRMLDEVIKVDPNNAKALSRRLQALLEMSKFDAARTELKELKAKTKILSGNW